jgi:hypothetical protein
VADERVRDRDETDSEPRPNLARELGAIAGEAIAGVARDTARGAKQWVGSFALAVIVAPIGCLTLAAVVALGWLIGILIGFDSPIGRAIPVPSIVLGVILATIVSVRVWRRRPAWIGRWILGEEDVGVPQPVLSLGALPRANDADRRMSSTDLREIDARFRAPGAERDGEVPDR